MDDGTRERRDARGAELFEASDAELRELIEAEVGAVSETTRELARAELEGRTPAPPSGGE